VRAYDVETTAELVEAIRTYEKQRPGRGGKFVAEVEATLRRIREAPLSFPRLHTVKRPILRRARVLRFPYSIVYYLLRGEPIVVAVHHARRSAGYLRARLR